MTWVNSYGKTRQTHRSVKARISDLASGQVTSGRDCWRQSFGYDAWGNLLAENVTKCSGTQLSVTVNAQNQITNSGISYDASGDMLTDGVNTYTYDAENRISTVNGTGAAYIYGPEGQRAMKQTGGGTTQYVYFHGQPIGERSSSGVWTDYIYSGSRRLASSIGSNENSTQWQLRARSDQLGTLGHGDARHQCGQRPFGE